MSIYSNLWWNLHIFCLRIINHNGAEAQWRRKLVQTVSLALIAATFDYSSVYAIIHCCFCWYKKLCVHTRQFIPLAKHNDDDYGGGRVVFLLLNDEKPDIRSNRVWSVIFYSKQFAFATLPVAASGLTARNTLSQWEIWSHLLSSISLCPRVSPGIPEMLAISNYECQR